MIHRATMTAVLALVAGCGGGNAASSAGTVSGVSPVAPTPAPTPVPAPAPTPTPTPTPTAASYVRFDDIYSTRFGSSGLSVQSACVGFDTAATPPAPLALSAFGRGLAFRYVVTPNVWSISGETNAGFDGRDSDPFAATLVDPSAIGALEWAYSKVIASGPARFTVRRPAIVGPPLDYTRLASVWATVNGAARLYQCAPGMPTVASELASVPPGAYPRAALHATAYLRDTARAYMLARSGATVAVDAAARRVTITLELTGVPADGAGGMLDFGTLTATLPVDPATGAFAGEFSATGRAVGGSISGQLFGPQGAELGLVLGSTVGAGAAMPAFTVAGAVFAAR